MTGRIGDAAVPGVGSPLESGVASASEPETGSGRRTAALEPLATGPVFAIAAAVFAVHVALSTRYGFHRDEPYYLWGGDHLAWGYVDHPPLVPLLARGASLAGDHTLLALRTLAAAVAGWLVIAGALITRELGGGRRAQVLAAFAVACVPATRAPEILFGTTAGDAAVWAVVLVLFTRLLRTERTALWGWIGLTVGIGLETKWAVGILVAGLTFGLVLSPARRLLWTPWALVAAITALALWLPNLWWNATHDWAFLEFQREVGADNGTLDKRLLFFPLVVLLAGLAPIVVWLPGWAWLRRSPFRPIAIAAVIIVLAVFVAGGKPYYVGPLLLPLLAAGAIVLDRGTATRRRTGVWVLAVTGLVTIPATLPALPARALDAIKPLNPEMGEMIGWPELVATTRQAYATLSPEEQRHAVILTSNYGSAAALRRGAPELPVASAHNDLWLEGPPPESATTVITVGYSPANLRTLCDAVTPIATITNEAGITNQEANRAVSRCTRDAPWTSVWGALKHYG